MKDEYDCIFKDSLHPIYKSWSQCGEAKYVPYILSDIEKVPTLVFIVNGMPWSVLCDIDTNDNKDKSLSLTTSAWSNYLAPLYEIKRGDVFVVGVHASNVNVMRIT